MTVRTAIPVGAPAWVDVSSTDQAASIAFYTQLFGWTCTEPDPAMGGYANFQKDGVYVAGSMPCMPDLPASVWTVYLATDDVEAATARAAEHGGDVLAPAMEVGDLTTFSVIRDPGGAAVGLQKPGTHPGLTVVEEPGTPSWFELHTRDHAKVLDFYRAVLGWQTTVVSDVDDFRYSTVACGGIDVVGVMDGTPYLPADVPAHWKVYWHVTDAAATLDRVVELGGTVLDPAQQTPYGVLAVAADPTGAAFSLRQL